MVVPEEGRFSTRPARKVASNSDCGQIKTSVVASGQKRPQISEICSPLPKWTGPGLNRRHQDFQSCALPTELPVRKNVLPQSPVAKRGSVHFSTETVLSFPRTGFKLDDIGFDGRPSRTGVPRLLGKCRNFLLDDQSGLTKSTKFGAAVNARS